MPPVKLRGDGRKARDPKKTMLRLLGFLKPYTGALIAVVLCIIVSAIASAESSRAVGSLVDDYITPMLSQEVPDFGPLIRFLAKLACIFLAGMAASLLNQLLMVKVTQSTQKEIRDQAFTHMQTLPIRYFDRNSGGRPDEPLHQRH